MRKLEKIRCDPSIPVPDVVGDNHVNHVAGDCVPAKKRKHGEEDGVTGSRVYALPNGVCPCNQYIGEIIDLVKPKVVQLVEDANMVMIPFPGPG